MFSTIHEQITFYILRLILGNRICCLFIRNLYVYCNSTLTKQYMPLKVYTVLKWVFCIVCLL